MTYDVIILFKESDVRNTRLVAGVSKYLSLAYS